jgi:MFS family permease
MVVFLAGRSVQGLGAAGLTVLAYRGATGDSEQTARYLFTLAMFTAAGTVCGPLLGAVLSTKYTWVQRFTRL